MKQQILFICKGHKHIAGAQLYLKQISSIFHPDHYDLHFALNLNDGVRVFDELSKTRFVRLWDYDWRHISFSAAFREIRKIIHNIRPEYVIFNSSEDKILAPIIGAYSQRGPNLVMVVHWALDINSLPLIVSRKNIPFPIISRYSLLCRIKRGVAFSLLSKIIFVNQSTRNAYIKLYKIPNEKCTTIYNGIETNRFAFSERIREKVRQELALGEEDIMLLSTGNLTAVKGHSFLIEAVGKLVRTGRQVKCFIAGQGELQESLAQQISEKNLSKHVYLLGFRNDILSLLAATDIFCMPSLNEALGYSLLEAMASGRAIVATNAGGIPEVITNNIEGLLVEPGNDEMLFEAIDKLISDKNLRVSMGNNGICKARDFFSLEKMLQKSAAFLGIHLQI